MIKSSLFRELHAIPAVSKNSDLSAIVEKVECVLRQLEALKESVDGTFLETILEDKMPSWVLEKVYEAKDASSSWSLSEMRSVLCRLAARREKISSILSERKVSKGEENSSLPRSTVKLKGKNSTPNKLSISSTLVSTTSEVPQQQSVGRSENQASSHWPNFMCSFCDQAHRTMQCKKYRSLNERQKRIVELKLCSRCLRSGHESDVCPSTKIKCFKLNIVVL